MSIIKLCESLTNEQLAGLQVSELSALYDQIKIDVDKSIKENSGYINMENEYILIPTLTRINYLISSKLIGNN